MKLVDANVFLRYLTRDDERKAQACFELFQRLKRGEEQATTSEVILHEVLYVLCSRSHYALAHTDAALRLKSLISLRALHLPQKRECLRALDLFSAHPFLDFADALSIARVEGQGLEAILSYDRGFDRVPGVTRLEP